MSIAALGLLTLCIAPHRRCSNRLFTSHPSGLCSRGLTKLTFQDPLCDVDLRSSPCLHWSSIGGRRDWQLQPKSLTSPNFSLSRVTLSPSWLSPISDVMYVMTPPAVTETVHKFIGRQGGGSRSVNCGLGSRRAVCDTSSQERSWTLPNMGRLSFT